MKRRLYCEECDQCYDGQGDPRSDHGHCQDCGGRLCIADAHLQDERVTYDYWGAPQWRGFPDEDHE
jgi:hypothetical protein